MIEAGGKVQFPFTYKAIAFKTNKQKIKLDFIVNRPISAFMSTCQPQMTPSEFPKKQGILKCQMPNPTLTQNHL